MFILSFNYRTADTRFRERLAFHERQTEDFLSHVRQTGIEECVYLATCNRCEIIGCGSYPPVTEILSEMTDIPLPLLREHILIYEEERAIKHLFYLCSGLDSMVIGEDEILGQTRDAYMFSKERGFTGYTLNTVFQAAFSCAKRIKTQTLLSKSAVSVATLAAYACHRFKEGRKTVLIAGASGDTGNKVILNLLSYGDCEILAATRTGHSRQKAVREVPYEQRYRYADQADVVISATKAPHYVFLSAGLSDITPKKRLFLDLAVPRDIDEDIGRLPGAKLLNMDDFEKTAAEHNRRKIHAAASAAEMIREDMDELLKSLQFHDFFPAFMKMQKAEESDFTHFVYRFRDAADAKELKSFLTVLKRMNGE